MKQIGARVVAHHVEIELAGGDLFEIDLRGEHALAAILGTGEQFALRVNDGAAAADQAVDELAAREYVAAALERDVPHRVEPPFAVVHRGGAVKLDALR